MERGRAGHTAMLLLVLPVDISTGSVAVCAHMHTSTPLPPPSSLELSPREILGHDLCQQACLVSITGVRRWPAAEADVAVLVLEALPPAQDAGSQGVSGGIQSICAG